MVKKTGVVLSDRTGCEYSSRISAGNTVETTNRGHPNRSIVRFGEGANTIVGKTPARPVDRRPVREYQQPEPAHPEATLPVLMHGVHAHRGYARSIINADQLTAFETEESPISSNPQIAATVFVNGANKTVRQSFVRAEQLERSSLVSNQSASFCAHPERSVSRTIQ